MGGEESTSVAKGVLIPQLLYPPTYYIIYHSMKSYNRITL